MTGTHHLGTLTADELMRKLTQAEREATLRALLSGIEAGSPQAISEAVLDAATWCEGRP